MAKDPRVQTVQHKLWWATLGLADAQDRIANHLGVIAEFLGAYGDNEGGEVPRLQEFLEELVSGKKRKK